MGWEYVYSDFDPRVSLEERTKIANVMIDMFYKGDKERDVDTGQCEARVYTRGEYASTGYFAGPIYRADITNDQGTFKMNVIVCKERPAWVDQDPDLN